MNIVRFTARFERAYKRYVRKHPNYERKIDAVIQKIEVDHLQPNLNTHPLRGELSGHFACSAGYDLRIIFRKEVDAKSNRTIIVLLDIGTHNEVY